MRILQIIKTFSSGVGRAAIQVSCAVQVISLNQEFMGHFVSKQNYPFFRHNNFVAANHKPPDAGRLTACYSNNLRILR